MSEDGEDWGTRFYKGLALVFLIGLSGYIGCGGCKANETEVQEALRGHGFTNIELGARDSSSVRARPPAHSRPPTPRASASRARFAAD